MAAVRRNNKKKQSQQPQSKSSSNCADAKSYLLQSTSKNDANLYDHLTRTLTKILDERPRNAVALFEDFSRRVKQERFSSTADNILDRSATSRESQLAETQLSLFTKSDDGGDEEYSSALPNLLELSFYLEQSGVGLSREEMIRIWLALKTLVDTQPVEHVRFWGKVLGTERNYIVAEVQWREGEGDDDEMEAEEQSEEREDRDRDGDGADEETEAETDFIPKPEYKRPPVVPVEEQRSGANKNSYFVCNEPGESWIRLPAVTPVQIVTARKIKKFFTGQLDTPVVSYPPFAGTEANYLRAQIARISAGTQISPLGFYLFDDDDDEQAKVRGLVQHNPDFEPMPLRDLVDPSLSSWVHHALHVLPQGRTTWWNPVTKSTDDADDDEDDDRQDGRNAEPEVGPPLLTPLSEDAEVNGMVPWTVRISSKLIAQYSVAVVHSCLWPGAHAFATGRHFENIYVGWGHKYSSVNYSPPPVVPAQAEYPRGPEITEAVDPSPEDEKALQKGGAVAGGDGTEDQMADDELADDGEIAGDDDEVGDDDDDDD